MGTSTSQPSCASDEKQRGAGHQPAVPHQPTPSLPSSENETQSLEPPEELATSTSFKDVNSTLVAENAVKVDISGPGHVRSTYQQQTITSRSYEFTQRGSFVTSDLRENNINVTEGDANFVIRGGAPPLTLETTHPLEGMSAEFLGYMDHDVLVELMEKFQECAPNHGFSRISKANLQKSSEPVLRKMLVAVLPKPL